MIGQGWPQERQYVDFKDRDGTWLVGLVMARNETHIRMRCEGWSSRYDQTIPASQESITRHAKIQPFRTHTRGYTGLKKACASREHWKFTPEDHESRTQKLEAFIEHLTEKTPFEMWQFLRGEHYFYLDFLMSGSYPTQQDLAKVYHYFKNHIRLCKLYLENMEKEGIMQWLDKDSASEGEKETWLGAYKQCYIEIFDGLYCVAGLNERLAVFLKINEKSIKQHVGIYQTHENYVSNELLVSGTFEALKKIINQAYIAAIDQSSPTKLPFLFSYTILQMFLIIQKTLLLQKDPQLEQLLEKIFVVIRRLYDEIDAQSLKGIIIDREIEFVLMHLKLAFMRHSRKEIVSDWIEEFKIKYYVFFIKSNSLERKIKGIVKIKEYCQEIIHCPPNRDPKMSRQKFKAQFNQLKCQQILFQQCQHSQIFKKSIQLVCFLYKCGMANIQSLAYAWNHSINKEPAVVKHLHHNWNEVALRVWPNDHSKFVEVVANFYSSDSAAKDTNESVQFVFKFVDCLTKNFNFYKFRSEPPANINNIQQSITLMIQELYEILLANLNRENQEILIEYYSRLVLWSSSSSHFILQLFNNLTHHIYFRISLFILSEIYLMAESETFFLPENFSITLLNCLKVSPLSLKETSMLMKLLNRILLASKQYQKGYDMKKEDFRQFWDYFQSVTQDKRALFYEWITQSRKAESEDQNLKTYDLFSKELKDYIVAEILCEESFSDLAHLTKKQLEIILQFFIEKNLTEQKLQEKNYYSDFRIVYRLRTVQLIKEDFLWTIFEKCKNSQVIHALNKNLIAFYFFYSPTVSYSLKKGRIDEFLIKLKTNLDTGHKDSNTGLIKNTLMLLKNVIELIKQDKKLEPAHSLNIACVKAQIYHDTRTYQLQVKYEDTVANIKIRVANYFSLQPMAFKLLNSKQEQMGFDTKDIPICCFSDKYFKVVEIPAEQQTLTKFINNFLNEEIEQILFRMLQNEKTALQVYEVLDELDFKQEKRLIFKRINDILEKHGQAQEESLTSIHCFYLLQLKLINRHMDDRQFIEQCCSHQNFSRFLRMMSHPIKINIHINFLHSITGLLIKFHKKGNFAHKRETSERCLTVIHELHRYAEVRKVEGPVKDLLNKINHNCVLLLQDIITLPQMLVFLFSLQHIQQMLLLIFFSSHFQEIKLLFIQRLKKYIAMYRSAKRRNQFIENRMADIFINLFYPKIMQYFENKKLRSQSKSHHELFIVIGKIVQIICPQNSSVTHPNTQKIISLHKRIHQFLCKIINSKELRALESSRFLITGHLNLLKTIISNVQQLKSADIIAFVMTQCLGVSNNVKKIPLCSHPDEIQSAFQIIRAHLCENTSAQFLKCIMDLFNPCQKVPLWRISNRWSINVSPQSKQQYRGLMNPGCICYMNSLLQQLFMIQEFRNGILSVNAVQPQPIEEENKGGAKRLLSRYNTILQSLKSLFLNLIFSEENIINPVPFAMTLKNSENRPMIRINQQMDIDEFESILFDKLQKELENQKSRNLIRELFGGVYSNQIVSAQCSHKSEREESFISISLEVKKNIYESFRSFVKVDVLDGDNKYFCQTCNKKVKAEKIQSIKKLPPYLILCLKRFEFNFQIETKIKINDYCEFYQKIKLKQFSSQELNRNSSAMDEQNDTKQAVLPDEYYNYKLRGVVVHTGSADSGHYYSFIENKQGQWFEFNDEDVYPFDIKKLPDQAFGSKGVYDDGRIRNAYLLIYEREVKETVAQQVEPQEKIFDNQCNKSSIEQILVRNQEIQKFQLVFSESYSRLVELMSTSYKKLHASDRKKISQQWQEFFLGYYFLVLIRKESFERFIQISEQLEKEISHNGDMSNSYLRLFTSCSFYQEFFIYNPQRERCRILTNLLYTALVRYSQENVYIAASRKPLLNMVLMAMKMILINHGHVLELAMALRKYLEYISQYDTAALRHIIFSYSFENVFLDHIFGNVLLPIQKEQFSKYMQQNKQTIHSSIVIPIELSQKRQCIDQPLQTWRILYFLLKEDNKILGNGGQRQQVILLKANYQHLVSVMAKAQLPKLMSAIYESHQQPNVDYLYKTFKQVGLLTRLKEAIQKGLKDYESSKYRPFMLLILNFIYDPQSTDEDMDALIVILENAYKHNEKYFLQVDLFNQWIIKFVTTSDRFGKRFRERKAFVEQILNWITKTPNPTADHLKKHKLPNNERLLNRYYGIVVSSDVKDYEKNNIYMKQFYQALLSSPAALSPSIIRLYEPLTPSKPIKYFDMVLLKWIDSVVVSNQLGYLTIQVGSKQSNHISLWEGSEKIRICKEEQLQDEKSQDSDVSYEESNQNEKF